MRAAKVTKDQSLEVQHRRMFRAYVSATDDGGNLEQPFAGEVVNSKTTTYSIRKEPQPMRIGEPIADAELE